MKNTRQALNDFFVSVQLRAYRQAELATGSKEDALDIVQDAMLKLAQSYAGQAESWPKLFQRILQNRIRDFYRRKKMRSFVSWFSDEGKNAEGEFNGSDQAHEFKANRLSEPDRGVQNVQESKHINAALKRLPPRQQQAFLLRAWWGYDTKESAFAMECSEGSVKTHYSRALAKLHELLNLKELDVGDYDE